MGAHFICDYPLQGDFLARAKNRHAPIEGVPWYHAMTAHAAMHGFAVAFITNVWWLGVLEFVCHFVIDELKCAGIFSFNNDQYFHFVCKLIWVGVVAWAI